MRKKAILVRMKHLVNKILFALTRISAGKMSFSSVYSATRAFQTELNITLEFLNSEFVLQYFNSSCKFKFSSGIGSNHWKNSSLLIVPVLS